MQRLYSRFPAGAPGIALVLIRLTLALAFAQARWPGKAEHQSPWLMIGLLVVLACLCLGLLTTGMGLVCAIVDAAGVALADVAWQPAHGYILINAIGLVLIGPGAYSIDATLFCRRTVIAKAAGQPRRVGRFWRLM